mmetsp:Transcript_32100/g.35560  ORF Transcript_32100/g.35560 Transcript_32100/m.35560 type:complete len:183 (+) Transcript_32100:46-594(+)
MIVPNCDKTPFLSTMKSIVDHTRYSRNESSEMHIQSLSLSSSVYKSVPQFLKMHCSLKQGQRMELRLFTREGYLEEETEEEELRNNNIDESTRIRNNTFIGESREALRSTDKYRRSKSNSEIETIKLHTRLSRHNSVPDFKRKSVTFDESVVFRSGSNLLKKSFKKKYFWRTSSNLRPSAEI